MMIPAPLFYAHKRCSKRAAGRHTRAARRSRIPDVIGDKPTTFSVMRDSRSKPAPVVHPKRQPGGQRSLRPLHSKRSISSRAARILNAEARDPSSHPARSQPAASGLLPTDRR